MPEFFQNLEIPNQTDTQKFNTEIYKALAAINTSLNILQNRQEQHHTVLIEGDGNDLPLTARMTNAEAFITEVRYWMKFLVGVVVINLVASTVAIVGALLRQL
jgi:hypothetical protein